MHAAEPYVAFSPLTQRDLDRLGPQLSVVYEIDDTRIFDDLLIAIDAAEKRGAQAGSGAE